MSDERIQVVGRRPAPQSRWTVLAWADIGRGYREFRQYEGDSLWSALRAFREARKGGVHRISIEWMKP